MNPSYPDLIYNGILICINIQLILFGTVKLFFKSYRNWALGLFCIFMATPFLYNLYWTDFRHNALYNILLGGHKHLFYAPLLYIYVSMLQKNKQHLQFFLKHISIPFAVHTGYLILKLGMPSFFHKNLYVIYNSVVHLASVIAIVYFIKSIFLFKKLKPILKPKVYKKYWWITFGFMGYWLLFKIESIIFTVFSIKLSPETLLAINRYFSNPLDIIVKIGVLFFLVLESDRIRKFMFGKSIYSEFELIDNDKEIIAFIKEHFELQKTFKNPDFDIIASLKTATIEEKKLRLYLKKEYGQTIKEFINAYRIREFKLLIANKDFEKYNLVGLAKEVGFKSKSTFYRHFKAKEGITPKEYLNTISKKEGDEI